MDNIRIVLVHDFAYVNGGSAKVAITEAIALAEGKYDVAYFAGVGPIASCLTQAGVHVVCADQSELKNQLGGIGQKLHGAIQGFWNNFAVQQFAMFLENYQPENTIIHFHCWSLALSQALFSVTAKRKFKIIITCHDYELNCPARTYYNFKKKEICSCKAMSIRCVLTDCDKRSYFQKIYRIIRQRVLYKLLKRNEVSIIHVGEMNKEFMDRELRIKCKEFIINNPVNIQPRINCHPEYNNRFLYIGRFSEEKGIEMFCEAVTKAGVEADAIGGGEEVKRLREKYKNVTFHGWLTPQEMVIYLKKARCLIVSSRWIEIGPLTVPEVQCAYHLPCIVPSKCGVLDDVEKNQSGLIYKIGDLDDLIRCIELAKNDSEIKRMSENCEAIDMRKYSVMSHIYQLTNVYDIILNKGEKNR